MCGHLLPGGGAGALLDPPASSPGDIEFTWQEVMIGLESSLLMFPINLLIVQLFRHARPRGAKEQDAGSPGPAPAPRPLDGGPVTPEAVTKAGPQPPQRGVVLPPPLSLSAVFSPVLGMNPEPAH